MIIAVDFDGTVVEHEYPEVGADVPLAANTLRKLVQTGHQIILWTMRHDEFLDAAVQWFIERDIPLFGINENPEQVTWTQSNKAYAHLYIDDAGIGCPTIASGDGRPRADWLLIENMLQERGIL